MESSILFLCILFLFCFMLVKAMKKSKAEKASGIKLPPGPKPFPVIGNMHQLFGGPIHHVLRDLSKKYGPLMYLKMGEISTIIVSSPEVAKEIYKTHDLLFSQRPSNILASKVISYNFTDIIFSPYGNYWRQIRKISMIELLGPKRVQTFQSIREEEVLNLIRSISLHEGSPLNLSQMIFSLTYGITARAAFGRRNKYQEQFKEFVEKISELTAGFNLADFYPSVKFLQVISGLRRKMESVHRQVDEILENILIEHRKKRTNSNYTGGEAEGDLLVDILLNIQETGDFELALTDRNIKAIIFDIFSAGSETSSVVVEWAMSELIKNPSVMKRAQDEVRNFFHENGNANESSLEELKYLQAVIKETLRLHPSAPLLVPRESSEECEIKGFQIPSKIRVLVNAWAIGRDPAYWIDAEKFKPERFLDSKIDYKGNDFEYIPFGAGRRICPGISYALPNIAFPLAQLLFHLDWKVAGDMEQENLDMTETVGVTVRRKHDLCLIPYLYSGSFLKLEQ